MADRFDKFTERARRVLTLAQEEAQRFNHNYIGTEHLLLGLVREGDGVAAKVLSNLGVELSKGRSAVEFIIGRGDPAAAGGSGPRRPPRPRAVAQLGMCLPTGARQAKLDPIVGREREIERMIQILSRRTKN